MVSGITSRMDIVVKEKIMWNLIIGAVLLYLMMKNKILVENNAKVLHNCIDE